MLAIKEKRLLAVGPAVVVVDAFPRIVVGAPADMTILRGDIVEAELEAAGFIKTSARNNTWRRKGSDQVMHVSQAWQSYFGSRRQT